MDTMDTIITNNIIVKTTYENYGENCGKRFQVEYIEGTLYDVLVCVRNHIHNGHILLTHTLSGSVKPNETPYKSVLISKRDKNESIDFQSLQIIEDSILTIRKFSFKEIPEEYLADLREVDFTLISSAISRRL